MPDTPTPLRAWPHPQIGKPAFMAIMQDHREQDRIVRGKYWDDGRGCAVGCSLETARRLLKMRKIEHSAHGLYETLLGVPRELAQLEDQIFESLPQDAALDWPLRFADAIVPGADLSQVWPQFAAWMLRTLALPAVSEAYPNVRAAVERVAVGFDAGWMNNDSAAADAAARAAAYAAAGAAAYAAAGAAAYAAADAVAAAAADAAAYAAAYAAMADKLLALLESAPVPEAV